jgi:hypothetical protein
MASFRCQSVGHILALSTVVMDGRSKVCVGIKTVEDTGIVLVPVFDSREIFELMWKKIEV